ncbi:MAG: serine/threonine protein kinase, partial [Myxococcales bacterium]|nr:serine/threonine protein kinase [Myxococcales bacterium]
MDLVPGSLLAQRYRAESLLGRGGMGEVWRCRDEDRGDEVAVKVLHAAGLDPRRRRLFRDEIVATAHLDHPGIVRVYDVIQEADNLALVMELELGRPLSKIDPLPFAEFRDLAIQVLEALAYAHARGVLHLDVKPSNVIVSGRPAGLRATLVDFGVARGWRQGEDLTDDTIVRGTLGYMAP